MTNENKMTYIKAVAFCIDNCDLPEDVAERMTALHASLVKRASAERKPTKAQIEAAHAREEIAERMEHGKLYSLAEIGKMFDKSPNWASPKMIALADAGVVVKTVDKRKVFYSLA